MTEQAGMEDSTTSIWPLVPLGEVLTRSEERVDIRPDREYLQVTVRLWGGGVVLRNEVSGAKIAAKKRYVVRSQQFLLSRIDARNGAFGLVPESLDGAVVSNDFPSFNINKQMLEPPFLEWMSKTKGFVDLCRAASEGTTNRVRLQVDRFLVTEIPLPPLDEQRRIVARIEELAALIEEGRGLRVKAREEAEALLASAIRQVFGVPEELPDHWRWVTVSDVGHKERDTVQTGPFGAQLSSSEFTHEGVPVLAIGNVRWGYLDTHDLKYVSEAKADQLSRYRVQPGDILVARMGTVGRSCVVPDSARNWLISYHLIRIAVDRSVCDPQFVFYALRGSPSVLEAIEEKTRGSTRAGVNSTILRQLRFPLPHLDEQLHVVAYLDDLQAQVDELTALQEVTQAELDALLPSVLDRAFRGEL
jgi:type I restriction enzyme S subunit